MEFDRNKGKGRNVPRNQENQHFLWGGGRFADWKKYIILYPDQHQYETDRISLLVNSTVLIVSLFELGKRKLEASPAPPSKKVKTSEELASASKPASSTKASSGGRVASSRGRGGTSRSPSKTSRGGEVTIQVNYIIKDSKFSFLIKKKSFFHDLFFLLCNSFFYMLPLTYSYIHNFIPSYGRFIT